MPIRPILLPLYEELFKLPIWKREKKESPKPPQNTDLFYELALKTSIFDRP